MENLDRLQVEKICHCASVELLVTTKCLLPTALCQSDGQAGWPVAHLLRRTWLTPQCIDWQAARDDNRFSQRSCLLPWENNDPILARNARVQNGDFGRLDEFSASAG